MNSIKITKTQWSNIIKYNIVTSINFQSHCDFPKDFANEPHQSPPAETKGSRAMRKTALISKSSTRTSPPRQFKQSETSDRERIYPSKPYLVKKVIQFSLRDLRPHPADMPQRKSCTAAGRTRSKESLPLPPWLANVTRPYLSSLVFCSISPLVPLLGRAFGRSNDSRTPFCLSRRARAAQRCETRFLFECLSDVQV